MGAAMLLLGVAPGSIEPPFVRKWTQRVGDQAVVVAVAEGLVYYGSQKGVGALDLATGDRRWSRLDDQWIVTAAIRDRTLYAIAEKEEKPALVAVDLDSRQTRTLARLALHTRHLALDSERVYLLDASATLRAYDRNSGGVIWSCSLLSAESPVAHLFQLVSTADGLYVGVTDVGEFGVDPQAGRVLWKHPSQFAGLYPPLVIGGDVITQLDTLRRVTVRTGKVVWKDEWSGSHAVLVDNVLVVSQEELLGRDVADGRVLWRLPRRDRIGFYAGGVAALSDGENAWILQRPVVCVTKDGRERWNSSAPLTGTPAYVDSKRVITTDSERILGYEAGVLPRLPTSDREKRALAGRLASEFELLDNAERAQLAKLTPFAFQPLLARYVGWAKADAAKPAALGSFAHYRLMTDALALLQATCRKEDTVLIEAACSTLGEQNEWRGALEPILQGMGDPARFVPALVKNLRSLPLKRRGESADLDAVADSSHPEAVALMIAALRDPRAAEAWRREAFRHLAGTGGTEGIQAVREAKPRRGRRKPWFDRIDLTQRERQANLSTKRDGRGRTWMLFHSAVLGNRSDLFVVQKVGSGWGRPLFTGVWTERTLHQEAPKAFRAIPIPQLCTTEWIRIFPGDEAIRRDSDRDGLTDVVESRLGTDLRRADTDGDGLADAFDPCPNAAPRPMGDTEKIIAACVEARFFLEDWGVPGAIELGSVKPFELYGYAHTLVWHASWNAGPLAQMYGGGVNLLSFHSPDRIADGSKRPRPAIEFSPDRKTARTVIRRSSGRLNGDGIEVRLKRVGGEWFVVDMQRLYAS
jgi:outer membrane protein assembly factor BamB